jgi:hypothetical protein
MPNNANSGRLNVRVGDSTWAYNHTSNKTNSWNKENYISGRELWTNKPFTQVWRTAEGGTTATGFTYFGTGSDSVGLSRPSMALEYTGTAGRLTGVWASYGDGVSYYARNDGAGRSAGLNGGALGEPTLAQDVSFYQGSTTNGTFVSTYEADGQTTLWVHNGTNFGTALRVSDTVYNVPTQRWQNIRTLRGASQTHLIGYDYPNKSLHYTRPTGASGTFSAHQIDGNLVTAGTDMGLYSAIDYDGTGLVVAYYDTQRTTLRIAYTNTETPTQASDWTKRDVLPANSDSGQYVSMKVEQNGKIRLAFYNSKEETIVYATATTRTGTFTTTNVDRGIKGGIWTDISVDNDGNPMIVYGETARMGNYDGVRMAYRSSSSTGSIAFTDAWEAVTMPSDFKVKNDRLNIEAWPPVNRTGTAITFASLGWNAAIGYAGEKTGSGENTFRIGYFTYPAYTGY